MMRIGIDARLLSEPVTGIGRYTIELTKELVKKDGHFFLYSARPFPIEQWQKDNVTVRSANFHRRSSKMLWSQTYLPYWASKDHLDVFWGATHRLPRYLPSSIARVVTIHDLVWKHAGETMRPFSRWVEKRLMPEAVQLADRIVVDSKSTLKDLEDEYPEAKQRIKVVYPGAPILPLAQEPEYLVSMGIIRPYFLFVGTLEPRKNLRRLLKAYSLLDDSIRHQYQMVIAGGKGWGSLDIHHLISDAGLEKQVVLTGYVDDVGLATLYTNALFLAMPSLYEGFGLPILEAMTQGVPALTSNNSSMPEVAGDAAMLIDPCDEMSIVAGLSSLLGNKAYRNELAGRAIANAKRFNWQNAAKDLWTIFEEARQVRNIDKEKSVL